MAGEKNWHNIVIRIEFPQLLEGPLWTAIFCSTAEFDEKFSFVLYTIWKGTYLYLYDEASVFFSKQITTEVQISGVCSRNGVTKKNGFFGFYSIMFVLVVNHAFAIFLKILKKS